MAEIPVLRLGPTIPFRERIRDEGQRSTQAIAEPSQDGLHRLSSLFLPGTRAGVATALTDRRDCDHRQLKDDMPIQTGLCRIAHIRLQGLQVRNRAHFPIGPL